jgi:hypothetical protein
MDAVKNFQSLLGLDPLIFNPIAQQYTIVLYWLLSY